MTWGFLWLMFVLKLPIAALLWLVWWAVHQQDEPGTEGGDGGDGGSKVPPDHRPSRGPRPPARRRGPHGDRCPPSPARVRTTVVRARDLQRH